MAEYREGAHTVFDIKYHLVWVTKYRYHVLKGDIALRARDIIRQVCMTKEIKILQGHVSVDHVHLFVSAEGSQALSRWVGALKRYLAMARRGMMHAQPAGGTAPAHNVNSARGGTLANNGGFSARNRPYGRAWQDGFFDHVLRSSESYGEKWEYVRMNPVRAGLVKQTEDWPFIGEIEKLRW